MLLALALLLACGSDSDLHGKGREPPGFDTADSAPLDTATDSTPPPPEEVCNGADDDGDGLVDEGFPDEDGNGRVDCLDQTCPALDVGTAGPVAVNPDTVAASGGGAAFPVTDPGDVVEQWNFLYPAADPDATSSWMAPAIGNLDDDDGNGRVDEMDSPEVVAILHGTAAWVVAIDGATGAEEWSYPDTNAGASAAIADVTDDGRPDVLTANGAGYTIALDGDGTLEWTATEKAAVLGYYMISAADLDADGQPEVIADNLVLDGATGNLRWDMAAFGWDCPYTHAAVGDVDDADGDQEVTYCGVLYDSDGTQLWDTGERGAYGMWPFLVQADKDSEAEIGFVGNRLSLWEADGTAIFATPYPADAATPGPPCVGDFDGDGAAEIAFGAYPALFLYELDGTLDWTAPSADISGDAGCSGFDIDGDGALEVLYGDQETLRIVDGATGAPIFQTNDHVSYTSLEYPTVADLDRDGTAEMVAVNNWGNQPAVVAYQHGGAGWNAAGPTWATHDFAVTTVDPDGQVPSVPEHSWEKYNVYRARTAVDGDGGLADLAVAITDVCVADCQYGPGAIAIQVRNEGARDVRAGTLLTLYVELGTTRVPLTTLTLPEVPSATILGGNEIPLGLADLRQDAFVAAVDDDGTGIGVVREWDETNNEDRWGDSACE